MPYLVNNSVDLFLNSDRETIIKQFAKLSPYANAEVAYGDLTEKLRNYYSGLDGWELLVLFSDNYNSLMIGQASKKQDNETSFLVRSKMVALAQLIIDRMNEPGFADKKTPTYQQASSHNQE